MPAVYLSNSDAISTFVNTSATVNEVNDINNSLRLELRSRIHKEISAAKWKSAIKRRRRYF